MFKADCTCEREVSRHTDSDFMGAVNSQGKLRSVGGHLTRHRGNLASWKSATQKSPSLSTTESELTSGALGAQECTCVVNLLEEMECKRHKCVTRMDNQAVLSMCKSDTCCGRVKHLTVRHHHLRCQVTEGKADVERVPTKENPADILTKPLPRHTHQFHAARLVFG